LPVVDECICSARCDTLESMTEHGHSAKSSSFSEPCSSALGPPICNWTTHEGASGSQLNTLLNTPYPNSSVKPTNYVEPNVKIAREYGQPQSPRTINACVPSQDQDTTAAAGRTRPTRG
jgi:hypothetical protein